MRIEGGLRIGVDLAPAHAMSHQERPVALYHEIRPEPVVERKRHDLPLNAFARPREAPPDAPGMPENLALS